MSIKNRTKRKHAEERRTRRAAFFSASKTTRGEWDARTRTRPLPPGRSYDPVLDDFRAPIECCNRHERRGEAAIGRRELRRFARGRWAKDFACTLRKFAERNGLYVPKPSTPRRLPGGLYEGSSIEVFVNGERIEGVTGINYDFR
jgi:hypothetical protein